MKTLVRVVAVAAFLFALPALAASDIVTDAGVTFKAPAGWTVKTDKGATLVSSPDGAVTMQILAFGAADAEKAMAELEKTVTQKVKDFKETSEAKEIEISGMKGVLGEAKGKVDGRDVEVGLMMLFTPSNRFFLMVTLVDPARATKHEKAFADFLQSIQPKK